jgi:hypothetical protein
MDVLPEAAAAAGYASVVMPNGFRNSDCLGIDHHQGWAFVAWSRKDGVLIAQDHSTRLIAVMDENGKDLKAMREERSAEPSRTPKRAMASSWAQLCIGME